MSLNSKLKNIFSSVCACGIGMILLSGCQGNGDYGTTDSGLQYKIIVDKPGKSAAPGDFMRISLKKRVHDTSVLNAHHQGVEYRWIHLQKSLGRKYDVMEGLMMLTKGDSAEFKVPVDEVKGVESRPSFVEEGDVIHYFVKVLDIKNREDFESEMAKKEKKQNKIDAQIIQQYIDSLGVEARMSDDGVAVIVHKTGEGEMLGDGQTVSVKYTGKTLEGRVFDSNEDSSFHHTDPLVFELGGGMMIPGMVSGMKLLKEGADATLIIPSSLAYGRRGRLPRIKPNEVLVFHVEVLDNKSAE